MKPKKPHHSKISWGLIHAGMIGYPPATLPSRRRPQNTEGAVGVMRRVANMRLAVKRRVANPANMNTAPGAVFLTAGLEEGRQPCQYEHCPRGCILDSRIKRRVANPANMNTAPGDVFLTAGLEEGSRPCQYEHCPKGGILDSRIGG